METVYYYSVKFNIHILKVIVILMEEEELSQSFSNYFEGEIFK